MPKAKRARPRLPDWAKNPEKYQYKKGSPEITKKKTYKLPSVIRPQPWKAEDVLKPKL